MAASAKTARATVKSPWAATRDCAAEREEKREAVLQAAAQAFAENGYYKTSLDSIAARLGVTKPTLYYYARSKDDLISAIADRALLQIMEAFESDGQAPALPQLQQLIRRYVEVMATDFGRCIMVTREVRLEGAGGEDLRLGMRKIAQRMRDLLEKGMADGSIGACDVRLTAFMIAGAVNEIPHWFSDDGPMSPATVAEKFANQLAAGLAPR